MLGMLVAHGRGLLSVHTWWVLGVAGAELLVLRVLSAGDVWVLDTGL